jgi:subtilisin-like proprotein convertase family protein
MRLVHLAFFLAGSYLLLPVVSQANCPGPFLLNVVSVTETTATLNWTPTGTETLWDVALVPTGSGLPGSPTLPGVSTHPVTHTGLMPGTTYDFYVRAICVGETSSWVKFSGVVNTALTNPSDCQLAIPIPDQECREVEIAVNTAPGTQLGVDVYLERIDLIIEHEWNDDIDLFLASPSGVQIVLSNDNGGNDDNYGNPNDMACDSVTSFVNEIATGACSLNSIEMAEAPFLGDFLPQESLALFNNGSSPIGTWTLIVCDDAADDTGSLEYVSLTFSTLACDAPKNVDLVSVDSTSAVLDWIPGNNCGNTIMEYGPPGFVPGAGGVAGEGTIFLVGCPEDVLLGLAPETTYEVYLREQCVGGGFSVNSCPITLTTTCSPQPATLLDDFDALDECPGICSTPCTLGGNWYNGVSDDMDWLVETGASNTPDTGPESDVSGNGNYLLLEGSGLCSVNDRAELYSNCLTIGANPVVGCHFGFSYYMYGTGVNSLSVEISLDGGLTWSELWSLEGDQGPQWLRQYLDLSTFDGQDAQLRFVGLKGTGNRSDIALDALTFYGSISQGPPPYTYYLDFDEDGYGDANESVTLCSATPPTGYVDNDLDCFDQSAEISPGLPETPCDGFDVNCNGNIDEFILPPPVAQGDTVCAGAFAVLSAEAAFSGEIIWYDTPTGGTPIDTGVVFTPVMPFENNSDTLRLVYFYAEEANILGCTSGERAEVVLGVFPQPELSITSDPFVPACAGDSVDLGGILLQDLNNTQATFTLHSALPPSPANEIFPLVFAPAADTYIYVVATSLGGCTDIDSLLIPVLPSPDAEIQGDLNLCQGGTGSLTAIDMGNGTGSLEYVWSNTSNLQTINLTGNQLVGTTSDYSVTITDDNFCTSSDTATVTIITSIPGVSTSVSPVTACNGTNGLITVTPQGGTGPYEVEWSGTTSGSDQFSGGTYSLSGLGQGAYFITLTDSSPEACPFVLPPIVVNGPQAAVAISSIEQVTCFGASDGCITLNVGGLNPVINWSNGETTVENCNLSAGLYSVTVTDGLCENIIENIEIIEPDTLTSKTAELEHVSCWGGTDGRILQVAGGGTPPYNFQWSNGATGPFQENLEAGSYFVTLTDANGCFLIDGPIIVEEPDPYLISDTISNVSCFGELTGSIALAISGNNAPYGYAWSNGSNLPHVEGLSAGNYSVTIQDSKGCLDTLSYLVDQPDSLVLLPTSVQSASCDGVADGSIEVQVTGGNLPYQYAWSTGDTTTTLTDLPSGTYVVTVTDNAGCAAVSDTLAIVSPNAIVVAAVLEQTTCLGADDGSIELTPLGGTAPFDYAWDIGATGPLIQGLETGTYTCTITDQVGCMDTISFDLGFNQPIFSMISAFPPNCHDGTNGQVFLNPLGGSGPYSFSWSNGSTEEDLEDVPAGDYVCTVTDAIGCLFITDTISLLNPDPIQILVRGIDSVSCFGAMDGQIDMQVTGGLPPYMYTWSNQQTTQDLFDVGAGSYILTVEDDLNCAITAPPVLLGQPTPLVLDVTSIDENIVCEANTLDSILAVASGGTLPYQFSWSNGSTDHFILGNQPGDYSVTVTDLYGCTDEVGEIKVPEPLPFLNLSSAAQYDYSGNCNDPGQSGSVQVAILGGAAPYQYSWNQGGMFGTTNADTLTIDPAAEGWYVVTVTDDFGCVEISDSVRIAYPEGLNAFLPSGGVTPISCFGETTGMISAAVDGGFGPYFYAWTNEMGDTVSLSNPLQNVGSGSYTLHVTDQVGCTELLGPIVIEEPNNPTAVSTLTVDVLCHGESTGEIYSTVAGGTSPYSYSWSNGAMTPNLINVPAGYYSLSVTDAQGCEETLDSILIIQPTQPMSDLESFAEPVTCFGAMDGSINLILFGGTPPYTYFWSNGTFSEDPEGLDVGSYFCEVVDAHGCFLVTDTFVITSPDALEVINLTVDSANYQMADGSASLEIGGGVTPYSYSWPTGDSTTMVEGLAAGTYVVTITDANECVLEVEVDVPERIINDVEFLSSAASWRVYPNPTQRQLWVEVEGLSTPELEFELLNILGKPISVQEKTVEGQTLVRIDLGELPGGIYLLRMLGKDQKILHTWKVRVE